MSRKDDLKDQPVERNRAPALDPIPAFEIESLNIDDLDVQELEQRLEMALIDPTATMYGWICGADCGANCTVNCGVNCTVDDTCGGNLCGSNSGGGGGGGGGCDGEARLALVEPC